MDDLWIDMAHPILPDSAELGESCPFASSWTRSGRAIGAEWAISSSVNVDRWKMFNQAVLFTMGQPRNAYCKLRKLDFTTQAQIKEYFLRVKILGTPGHQNRMTNPNLRHKTKHSTTGLKSRPWQNNDKQCYHRYMGSNVFDMVSNILVCLDWYCFISWLILDCQS